MLAADRDYRYWFSIGPLPAPFRVDVGLAQALPPVDPPPGTLLRVILFPFAGGLLVDPAADEGELQFRPDGSLVVCRQPDGGPPDPERLFFPIRTPAHPGSYRLRVSIYLGARLLQSRVLEARVGRWQHPAVRQAISSTTDYTVADTLAPDTLAEMRPPRVSVLVNDGTGGGHDFRFVGATSLTGTATVDADALHSLLASARRALGAASWGTAEEWHDGDQDRYAVPRAPADMASDLIALARAGYRIWHALAHALAQVVDGQPAATGGRERVDELTALLLRSGTLELASRQSLRLAVPSALIYDYPLDSNRTTLQFCRTAAAALAARAPDLTAEPCFDGRCPDYHRLDVVCPGGFWGYRHEIGVPLSLGSAGSGGATDMTSRIPGGDDPVFVVGSTTDPQFTRRLQHLSRLRMLHNPLTWQLGEERDAVLDLLHRSAPHVVYFLCHGVEKDGLPGLVVGDPRRPYAITPDNLAAYRIAWPATRPLVVLNGCRTSALDPTKPLNFVEAFLRDAHASGVIGTEVTVFEPLACAFAEEVLHRFVGDDVTLGRAVRESRLALLRQGNPLGLAYVPYAPTELRMV